LNLIAQDKVKATVWLTLKSTEQKQFCSFYHVAIVIKWQVPFNKLA